MMAAGHGYAHTTQDRPTQHVPQKSYVKHQGARDTAVPRTEKKHVRSTESGVDPRQGTGRSDDGPADRHSAGCPAATTEEHGRREVSFTELSVGRVLRSTC